MIRNKFTIGFYMVIGLAIIGVISQIFINPASLFKSILMTIGFTVIILAAFYFIFLRNRSNVNNDDMKKYKQAVKQSQRKYKKSTSNQVIDSRKRKQYTQVKRKTKPRTSHLRVIDGTGRKQNEKNEPYFK